MFSGYRAANIIYTKVIEGCEAAHEFSIEYPTANKRLYDPVVARLSRTLSCRRGSPRSDRTALGKAVTTLQQDAKVDSSGRRNILK